MKDSDSLLRRPSVTPDKINFGFRKFISITIFFTLIILCVSGIALYIKPEGDIANWTGWTFLGLDKTGWEGFHVLFSLFFLAFAVMHLLYNWRAFLHHLQQKTAHGLLVKKELLASLAVVIAFLVFTVFQVQPFWKIAQWRQTVKKIKSRIIVEEPVPDFHKRKISAVAEYFNMPVEALIERLKRQNILIKNADERLLDIAKANKTSSEKMFILLKENE
jgi:magnesium-transporting ATPase (P-type)